MESITLNNGNTCPVVGIGTFMLSPADAENSVREALKMGYSLVDTANAYVNGQLAGRGSPAGEGLPRRQGQGHRYLQLRGQVHRGTGDEMGDRAAIHSGRGAPVFHPEGTAQDA